MPPLDGSHVIRHFLSYNALRVYDRIGYGGLMVIMFILPYDGNLNCRRTDYAFHGVLPRAARFVPELPMTDTNRTKKGRVLSGMRPTGKLHLGNYVGALRNWVGLQDRYDCFFFIADWHALTTDYADTRSVKQNSLEVMIDYLAAGLDPERSTLFIQSHVLQHAELHLLFSMITPLDGWSACPATKSNARTSATKISALTAFSDTRCCSRRIDTSCDLPEAVLFLSARTKSHMWSYRARWQGGSTSSTHARCRASNHDPTA